MKKISISAGLAGSILAALAAPAFADSDRTCASAPEGSWKPMAAAEEAVQGLGYTVTRSSSKRSCYEFHAMKDGQRFELYVDPATLAIVRSKAK